MFWSGGVWQGPYWTSGLPGVVVGELVASRSVSVEELRSDVVVGEVVVGWPVSVEALHSGVGQCMSVVTTMDDDRVQTDYSKLPIL